MSFNWVHYDSTPANNINDAQLDAALLLLIQTAKVHEGLLAVRGSKPPVVDPGAKAEIMQRINTPGHGLNWMKMSLGSDSGGVVRVVIAYHLLKHRLSTTSHPWTGFDGKEWSISVGFDQALFRPGQEGQNPDLPTNPYAILAIEINSVILKDIGGFQPAVKGLVWIDDSEIPTGQNYPYDYQVETVAQRRAKPIGELGYVAENNAQIRKAWPNWNSYLRDIPRHVDNTLNANYPIKDYGRYGHKVLVTEVSQ